MDLVEVEQSRQVIELLVPNLEATSGQRIDDVVGDPRVLGDGQHVIPGAGGGVPDEEDAVPLPLQSRLCLLS